MSAEYINLYVEQGSDFYQEIPLTGNYGKGFNLADGVVDSQFKQSYTSANVAGTFVATVDSGNNTVILTLPAGVSSNLASGKYVYDAVLYNSSKKSIKRLIEGIVEIVPGVTINPELIEANTNNMLLISQNIIDNIIFDWGKTTSNNMIQLNNQNIIDTIIFG